MCIVLNFNSGLTVIVPKLTFLGAGYGAGLLRNPCFSMKKKVYKFKMTEQISYIA
jgi:hypothetical protein